MVDLLERIRGDWFVACRTSALRGRPRAVSVLGVPLAVFPGPGALEDVCPHRMAPLSRGRMVDGRLACPYHGWEFDRSGACRRIPGLESVPAGHGGRPWRAVASDAYVWVSGGAPLGAPAPLPLFGESGHTSWRFEVRMTGAFVDVVENFLDPMHTHFVHPGLVRTSARRRVRAVVRAIPDGVEAEYFGEGEQSGLIGRLFGGGITSSVGRFVLPSRVELEYRRGQMVAMNICGNLTPESEDRHRGFVTVTARGRGPHMHLLYALLYPMLRLAIHQDARILEMQRVNKARFPRPMQASTDLDVLGGDVVRLLRGRPVREREVRLLL